MPARNHGLPCAASRRRYRLGDLLLDDGTNEVRRGGVLIDLPGLSYRLLRSLAEVAPHVLAHDAIVKRVWPGRNVSPETVTQRVKLLRQALGDDARNPRYIGLARGEGYRLLVDVEELEPIMPTQQRSAAVSRQRHVAYGLLALIIAVTAAAIYVPRESGSTQGPQVPAAIVENQQKSIAVLPFVQMSSDERLAYLGHGIADQILHRLSQNADLHVIARTSSFSLAEREATIDEISRLLGVRYVLQGSVRRSDDVVRVTAQLVDAPAARQIWSRAYDVGLIDTIEVQDAIASELGRLLDVRLGARSDGQGTIRPEAYEQFLRAEYFFNRRTPGDVARAEASYRNALQLDPDFARAWVGLAGALYVELADGFDPIDRAESLAEQRHALERALELQPDLAEAHIRLATYYEQTANRERARWHHARAWELDPTNPLILVIRAGRVAWHDLDESIRLQRRAIALNPLAASYRNNLALSLILNGQLDEAQAEIMRAIAFDPAQGQYYETFFPVIHLLQERYREALALADQLSDGSQRDAIRAMAYHALGHDRESLEALGRIELMNEPMAIVHTAEARAFMGDRTAARTAIEKLDEFSPETTGELARFTDAWTSLRFSPFLRDVFADGDLSKRVLE